MSRHHRATRTNPAAHPIHHAPPIQSAPGRPPEDWTIERRLEHTSDELLLAVGDLRDALARIAEPARHITVPLDSTRTYATDQAGETWASFGVLNPNPYTILLGINGPATTQGRATSVPTNSVLVLPIHVQDLEIAADPADIALYGAAVVHIFRYRTVQPLFLGSLD